MMPALGLVARQLDAASNPLRRSVASRSSADKAKMSFSRGAARRVSTRASLSPETAENVVMQISGVIKFGAPMYNKGDARGCARLYRQTALSIARDASVTSEEIRSCLRDAVAKADEIARKAAEEDPMGGEEDQRTQERVAWALRRGLDRVVDLIMDPPVDEHPSAGDSTLEDGVAEDRLLATVGGHRGDEALVVGVGFDVLYVTEEDIVSSWGLGRIGAASQEDQGQK